MVALFHGNCQTEALRMMFERIPSFTAEHEIVTIPAVHDLTAGDLPAITDQLARTDLLITQAIRDDYRGLPVGSEQFAALAPNAQVVRLPALYSDATFPFQVYVRDDQGLPVDAPLTVYHDLRALALAAAGRGPDAVGGLLASHRPPTSALQQTAEVGDQRLLALEREADIEITDWIFDPANRAKAFWAVNHPTLEVLDVLVARVQRHLGLPAEVSELRDEILGRFRTPIERAAIEALGLDAFSNTRWVVDGATYDLADVIARNVEFLNERPELIETGLADHADRIAALGLSQTDIGQAAPAMTTPTTPASPAHGWLRLPSREQATRDAIGVKPQSYLPIYEQLLAPLRDRPISILEMGVWDGDSLLMWRDAFPSATLVGIDLDPPLRDLGEGIAVHTADQTDGARLAELRRTHAPDGFDLIIDDASHFGTETAHSLQVLFREHLRPGGIYVIEDWGTGYLEQWYDGQAPEQALSVGALDQSEPVEGTVVRMPSHDIGLVGLIKRLADHVAQGTISSLQPQQFEDALPIASMSVFDGVVALHKRP